MLFYWFMGFFSRGPPSRTSERADCESSLLLSSTNALGLSCALARKKWGEREKEKEKEKRRKEKEIERAKGKGEEQ